MMKNIALCWRKLKRIARKRRRWEANVRDFKIQRRGRQRERQKNEMFNKQNHNFCTYITLSCTFLSCFCTTSTWKCLISRFKEDVNKQRRNLISLPELEYGHFSWNSTLGGFAYIWQSKWVGIIAVKTKRTQIYFLSDVLVAVASLDLKVPIVNALKRLGVTAVQLV